MNPRILLFLLLTSLLSALPAWAQDSSTVVELSDDSGIVRIEDYVQYLADDAGEISIEEARESEFLPVEGGAFLLKRQN